MMVRKTLSFFLCALLLLSLSLAAAAGENPHVIDEADLLTSGEESMLEDSAASLLESCRLDVVILTVDTTYGESVQTYADDYYDSHGYGYGEDHSGILLLLCMDTREWYISTAGDAIYIFTDYGLDQMGQLMLPYLADGYYYDAFRLWLEDIPAYVQAYENGSPFDGYVGPDAYDPEGGDEIVYYQPETQPNYFGRFLVALLIGLIAAAVTVLIMRSQMNTARPQQNAVGYLKQGSYNLNTHRDLFLYRTVQKTPRQQSSGGGHGGGSSVHRSSGGTSHGGRGGKF